MTTGAAERKKVVVLSSQGGGGHVSAWQAAYHELSPDFDVVRFDPLDAALSSLDPLRKMSGGRWSGEDFYNFLMRRGWMGIASWLAIDYGRKTFVDKAEDIERLLSPQLDALAPDVIISVIPFINAVVFRYARQRNIPFVVLPVDFDASNYANGFSAEMLEEAKAPFTFCLLFDDDGMRRSIANAGLPPARVRVTGFPLRSDFLERKERAALRAEHGIAGDRPVVMLLMGAAGSSRMVSFARALSQLQHAAHLLCCVGRNAPLEHDINAIALPPHVTRTLVGFTDRISDFMALSDVLVTKPGPGTIAEAISQQLPVVLDAGARVLTWERLCVDFVARKKIGELAESPADAAARVDACLENTERLGGYRAAMNQIPSLNCWASIRSFIAESTR